jgi:hypothetical protein
MSPKGKRLAAMLAIAVVVVNLAVVNMRFAHSIGQGGKLDLYTQKEPFSGKGPNEPSDAFGPQELVQIYANATYNDYPVQNLLVAIEVSGPKNPVENISFVRNELTNATGMATFNFRISLLNVSAFGKWTVLGVATLVNSTVQDTVMFMVGWIVKIVSLRTLNENYVEQENFTLGSYVEIEVGLQNIAMINKTATLDIVIYDSANISISSAEIDNVVVKANETLVYKYVLFYIPKTAHSGRATIYAGAYTAPLELGGVAYSPEASVHFSIITVSYFLRVETEPANITAIFGGGWYAANQSFSLIAPDSMSQSAGTRYKFSYWDVDGVSRERGVNPITVFMDGNHTATAHYLLQYYLTIRTNVSEITILGEGWYNESTTVNLTASAVINYRFNYWTVDNISQGAEVSSIAVLMNAPHTATAVYSLMFPMMEYSLTIVATQGGTTSPLPGTYNYTEGSIVQVEAIASENYTFNHWELDEANVGSSSSYSVLMDGNHTLEAVFSVVPTHLLIPKILFLALLSGLVVLVGICVFFALSYMLLRRRIKRKKKKLQEEVYTVIVHPHI